MSEANASLLDENGALKPLQDKEYSPDDKPDLVDSSEQKLDIGKVVVTASYHTKSKYAPNVVAMAIMQELQMEGTLFQQIGNTLFIAHPSKEPGKFVFRALNADIVENYVENSIQFIEWMKTQGAQELATQFDDPKILKLIKYVANQMVTKEGAPLGYRAYKNKNGGYMAVITVVGGQQ